MSGVDFNNRVSLNSVHGDAPLTFGSRQGYGYTSIQPSQDIVDLKHKGKGDGKFTLLEAGKNFLKGVISPITAFFEKPLESILITAAGLALAAINPPLFIPILFAVGGAFSVYQGGKGVVNAALHYANGEYDLAEEAFQDIGAGSVGIGMTLAGARGTAKMVTEAKTTAQALQQGKSMAQATKAGLEAAEKANGLSTFDAVKESLSLFTKPEGRQTLRFLSRKEQFAMHFDGLLNHVERFRKLNYKTLTNPDIEGKLTGIQGAFNKVYGPPAGLDPKVRLVQTGETIGDDLVRFVSKNNEILVNPEAVRRATPRELHLQLFDAMAQQRAAAQRALTPGLGQAIQRQHLEGAIAGIGGLDDAGRTALIDDLLKLANDPLIVDAKGAERQLEILAHLKANPKGDHVAQLLTELDQLGYGGLKAPPVSGKKHLPLSRKLIEDQLAILGDTQSTPPSIQNAQAQLDNILSVVEKQKNTITQNLTARAKTQAEAFATANTPQAKAIQGVYGTTDAQRANFHQLYEAQARRVQGIHHDALLLEGKGVTPGNPPTFMKKPDGTAYTNTELAAEYVGRSQGKGAPIEGAFRADVRNNGIIKALQAELADYDAQLAKLFNNPQLTADEVAKVLAKGDEIPATWGTLTDPMAYRDMMGKRIHLQQQLNANEAALKSIDVQKQLEPLIQIQHPNTSQQADIAKYQKQLGELAQAQQIGNTTPPRAPQPFILAPIVAPYGYHNQD